MLKKLILYCATLICCVAPLLSMDAQTYSGGDGTQQNPYKISTRNDLVKLSAAVNSGTYGMNYTYFQLINDIDMGGKAAGSFIPIGLYDNLYQKSFCGDFNGQGHVISNLYIDTEEVNNIGFFGYIVKSNVYDLALTNVYVNVTTVEINPAMHIGGLVGFSRCDDTNTKPSNIYNCCVTGSVSGRATVGGLVGANFKSNITHCYAMCRVSGVAKEIGGLVGSNLGDVKNSYAASIVSGQAPIGGVVGSRFHGEEEYNCYYDKEKCPGMVAVGGEDETDNLKGLSTAEMKSARFVTDTMKTPFVVAENSYPLLAWQDSHVVTLHNARFAGLSSTFSHARYGTGMSDTIIAIVPQDSRFVRWKGNPEALRSPTDPETIFTMHKTDLTFEPVILKQNQFEIVVTNGTSDKEIVQQGELVTVSAPNVAEKSFYKWSAVGLTLTADSEKANPMTFSMPNTDVTLTAIYISEPSTKSWIWAHYEKDTPEGITIDCLRLGDGVKSANLYRLAFDNVKEKKVGTFKKGKATYIIDADPNLVLNKEYAYELRVKKAVNATDKAIFNVGVLRDTSFAGEIVAIGAGSNVLVGDNTLTFDRSPSVKGWYTDNFGKKPKTKKISYKLTEKVSGNVDTVNVYTTASVPMFNSKDFKKRTDSAVKWIADNQDEIAVSYYAKNVNKALKYKKDYHTNLCDSFIAPQIDTILLNNVVCYVPDSKVLTLHTDSEDYKLIFEGPACGYSTPKAFIEYKDGAKFKQANLKVSAVMKKDTTTKSKFVNKDGVSKFQVTIPAKKWTKKPLTDPSCLVISTGKGMTAIPVIIQK